MDKMCMMFLVMGAKVIGACDSHVTEPQLSCVIARARKRDRTFDSPRVTVAAGWLRARRVARACHATVTRTRLDRHVFLTMWLPFMNGNHIAVLLFVVTFGINFIGDQANACMKRKMGVAS